MNDRKKARPSAAGTAKEPTAKLAGKAPGAKPAPKVAGVKAATTRARAAGKPAAAMAPEPPHTPPLEAVRYRSVALGGLGHSTAVEARSMAWFRDRLYVGTATSGPTGPADRARIIAHDPAATGTGQWKTVYESPVISPGGQDMARLARLNPAAGGQGRRLVQATASQQVARDFAITAMQVFQGASDRAPCLYCGTSSLGGGLILRSEDGAEFEAVTLPGIDDGNQMSFAAMAEFDGRLVVAPMGTLSAHRAAHHQAPAPVLYASADPDLGDWQRIAPPQFAATGAAAEAVSGVFSLAVFGGHLYAGLGNPLAGFSLWRVAPGGLTAEGAAWEMVLQRGAWRFNHNPLPLRMCVFDGALYLGTGIQGLGRDEQNDVGPCAAELIRVNSDGTWDLIMGEPRFTPDGMKVPLSAKAPGFSDGCNGAILSMAVLEGTLFVGTGNWRSLAMAGSRASEPIRGGFELWASADGTTWSRVLQGGRGKPASTGAASLCATPAGLYVGIENQAGAILKMIPDHRGLARLTGDMTEGFEVLLAGWQAPG